jgi:HAD superfamily hydrolase (TIGR01509 family)
MSNKMVIWDLDGVLISSREMHFKALNQALSDVSHKFIISWDEHLSKYDGLPTTKKLLLLTKEKGLPATFYDLIWKSKQRYTIEMYQDIQPNPDLQSIFEILRMNGIRNAVYSNSIRKTLVMALSRLGIMEQVDFFVSNEDVKNPKPSPDGYWKCMIALKTDVNNTVVVEDSHIGREGAIASGAHLIPVRDQNDVNQSLCDSIIEYFDGAKKSAIPWRDKKLNVIVPMAGHGSRFAVAGYVFPKPLINVNGRPMIQVVKESLNIDAHYIFIVQRSHYEKYQLKYMLNMIAPGCDIVLADGVTEGAACTVLLARELINNEQPILIANSDQSVEWNSNECLYAFSAAGIDGGIITFKSVHPQYSFARTDDQGFVSEVAEKKVISDQATVGLYYWTHGADFVKYAEQMIAKNLRVNNEFYVCPVYNEAIQDGKKIRVKNVEKMWSLGTPEDLNRYLREHHT